MSDIPDAFADDGALVPYLTAGDPTPEDTKTYAEALADGGADVIELGLPHSEPIADGPTIQNAIVRSLEGGMTPSGYLELVSTLEVETPIVCMTYYNLLVQFGAEPGVEAFVDAAADAGLSGLIVPDLPVEESDPLQAACAAHGLDLIFIVAPTTTDERIETILEASSGFVYVQARLGTTGAQADVSEQTYESLDRLPQTELPTAVGFGVSSGEQAAAIARGGADGVVVGSALVDIVSDGDDVAARLEAKARELRGGLTRALEKPERT